MRDIPHLVLGVDKMLYGMKDIQNFLREKGHHLRLINTRDHIVQPHMELLLLIQEGEPVCAVGVDELSVDNEITQLFIVCESMGTDYMELPHVATYAHLYTWDDEANDFVTSISVVSKHMLIFNGFKEDSDTLAREFINYMLRSI